MMPRPSDACRRALLVIILAAALPAMVRAEDARLAPLKDLDGSFFFTPPATLDAWKERAAEVRRSSPCVLCRGRERPLNWRIGSGRTTWQVRREFCYIPHGQARGLGLYFRRGSA